MNLPPCLWACLDQWGDEINPLIVWKLRRVWKAWPLLPIGIVLGIGLFFYAKLGLEFTAEELALGTEIGAWLWSLGCCFFLGIPILELNTFGGKDEMFKLHGLSPLEVYHDNILVSGMTFGLIWLAGLPCIVLLACFGVPFWNLFLGITLLPLALVSSAVLIAFPDNFILKKWFQRLVFGLAMVPYVMIGGAGPYAILVILLCGDPGYNHLALGPIFILVLLLFIAACYTFGRLQLAWNLRHPYRLAWYYLVFTVVLYPLLAVIWYLLAPR